MMRKLGKSIANSLRLPGFVLLLTVLLTALTVVACSDVAAPTATPAPEQAATPILEPAATRTLTPTSTPFPAVFLLTPLDDEKFSEEWFNTVGYLDAYEGNYELALANFSIAIALNPDYLYAYINRGVVYAVTGEYERALSDIEVARRLNPDCGMSLIAQGMVRSLMGDDTEAWAYGHEASSLGFQNC